MSIKRQKEVQVPSNEALQRLKTGKRRRIPAK